MIFTEPRFLLFFGLVFFLYWMLPTDRERKPLLLVASYVFYGAWDWRFLSLLLFSTLLDFYIGLALDRTGDPQKRKWLVAASCVGNLGLLAVFKYYDFFARSANALLERLGLSFALPFIDVVLPVGISFYTFQTLSYAIDVYRHQLRARQSLLDFALFVAFFPQLVAGPIVRAVDFLFQLDRERRWADVPVRACLTLFLFGYVKKACVADFLARWADPVFHDPAAYSSGDNWLALLCYHVQLYCDFSGYTDMALGTAGLLGYTLTRNFDFPYFANNVRLFWRRWHISLSSWLKDYLYVPLGGNRGSRLRTSFNLYVVLVLCGLWHGAGWNFILFGFIHGIYLTAVQWWAVAAPRVPRVAAAIGATGPLLMNFALLMSWVVFRAEEWSNCGEMYRRLFGAGEPVAARLDPALGLVVLGFFLVHYAMWKRFLHDRAARMPGVVFAGLLGAGSALALFFTQAEYRAFIYFQF